MTENKNKRFYEKISEIDRFTFLFTLISSILIHAYSYLNQIFIYDACHTYDNSTGLENGRFLVGPILTLFSSFQIPWIYGILFACCMAVASVYIRRIFDLKDKVCCALLSLLLTTFPVVFYTHLFIGSLFIYGIALLSSVMTVYCLSQKNKFYFICAPLFLIISLGCYQAYLPFSVSLYLLYIIKNTIETGDNKDSFKKLVKGAVIFIASVGVYYLIWQILLKVFPVEVPLYRGEANVLKNTFTDFFANIVVAYLLGAKALFSNMFYFSKTAQIQFAIQLIIIISDIIFILKSKKIMAILSGLALPLSVYLIYVFSPYAPHSLMRYALIIPYILFIYFLSRENIFKKAKFKEVACVLLAVFVFNNFVTGNAAYVKNYTDMQKAMSMATRLVDRIENFEGVTTGTNVIFFEKDNQDWYCIDKEYFSGRNKRPPKYTDSRDWKCLTSEFTCSGGTVGAPYIDALIWFIKDNCDYVGFSYSTINPHDEPYNSMKELKELDSFPSENCILRLDENTIIVCL